MFIAVFSAGARVIKNPLLYLDAKLSCRYLLYSLFIYLLVRLLLSLYRFLSFLGLEVI